MDEALDMDGGAEGRQPHAVTDPVAGIRDNPGLKPADLAALRADRRLAERVVAELPLHRLANQHACGILVTALRVAGLPIEGVARYAADWFLDSHAIRIELREARPSLFLATLREARRRGVLERDKPRNILTLAQDMVLMGQFKPLLEEVATAALAPAARSAEFALECARAKAMLGDWNGALHAATDAGSAPMIEPESFPKRQSRLIGWIRHHGGLPPAPEGAPVEQQLGEVLQTLFPGEVALPEAGQPGPRMVDPATARAFVDGIARMKPDAIRLFGHDDPALADLAREAGLPELGRCIATAPYANLLAKGLTPAQAAPVTADALEMLHAGYAGNLSEGLTRHRLLTGWRIDDLLRGHGWSMIRPHDGALRTTHHLLPLEPGRFLDAMPFLDPGTPERSFVVLSCGWNALRPDLLLCPAQGMACLLGPYHDIAPPSDALAALVLACRAQPERIAAWLSRPAKLALASGFHPNIGHHYQNELAGLFQAARTGAVPQDTMLLRGPYDYYGAVPACGLADTVRSQDCDAAAVRDRALDEGWSVINPRTIGAPPKLAAAVLREAERRVGAAPGGPPAVLFMLRNNRRIWRSQQAGITAAVRHLWYRHGITRVMLDGVTRAGPDSAGLRQLIEDESALARAITETLATTEAAVTVESLIGLTMDEKLMRHRDVLLTVCPKGNGLLPNLTWVRNIRAVVHGNAQDILGARWEAMYRPDAQIPMPIDRDDILDELGRQLDAGGPPRAFGDAMVMDYDLDTEGLLRTVSIAMDQVFADGSR